MDSNKEIKKVFELFTENKFQEAQELNNKILESFPNHMYAKRYKKILADKINFDKKNISEKSAKVKGKSLKCVHCLAKIPFSGLTGEQIDKIKKGDYNNLEIKCPYCHTKFVLQKRKANSILGLKIGNIANIEGKKYRVVGYVKYKGRWYEGGYSGGVEYLEWLLLGENNDYKYFSEGKSSDDGIWTDEFELSEKYIPKRIGKIDYIKQTAEIDGKHLFAKEKDKLTVFSVYGENSKNTKVGEKVEIYDFGDIIIEKETSGNQKEAGFYKTKKLTGKQAATIFGKEYSNLKNIGAKFGKGISNDLWGWVVFIFIFGVNFISLIPVEYILGGFGLIITLILFFIFKEKIPEKYSKLIYFIIALPIFSFFIFQPIFNSVLENKEKIEISKLDKADKAELKFKDFSVMDEKQTSSTRYDYGGTRTYYSKNIGLKFSVKTEEDRKILNKITELEEESKLKKMFNGDLYKLK